MADNPDNGPATPVVEQAKQQAQQAVQQGQQYATQALGAAQSQLQRYVGGQKDRAATGLNDLAQVLRQTSSQLQEQGQAGSSHIANQAADRITQVAETVSQKEVAELIADTENFARARPAAFLSIAAFLGFLLARFLKSSGQSVGAAA